jgi:trans-2,3-dihydro-3-hydroxyanthranilate isomerase
MRRRFFTLDVFSARRFAGNPLAVVFDSRGLDEAAMQMIAGEFNLAETVFLLPARDSSHRARLRIFTPMAELQFAGHPTVGAAVLLNWIDGGFARKFVLEEGIGPIRCTTASIDPDRGRARFELTRLPVEAGQAASAEKVAKALSLRTDDIGFEVFRPSRWSAGVPMTFVPVRNLDAMRRCQTSLLEWDAAFGQDEKGIAYVFCRETIETGSDFHARMFAPRLGVGEDPATGAAGRRVLRGLCALQATANWTSRTLDRARLRNGSAKPHRSLDDSRRWGACCSHHQRRRDHCQRRHDRGVNTGSSEEWRMAKARTSRNRIAVDDHWDLVSCCRDTSVLATEQLIDPATMAACGG